MISPLQKAPLGLLQAYNLQTLGQAPSGFSDTVVPVAAADVYYVRDLLVADDSVAAVISAGQITATSTLTVPSAEQWLVYAITAGHNPPAGDIALEVYLNARFTLQGNTSVQLAHQSFLPGITSLTSANDHSIEFWLPQPFLLRPGDAATSTSVLSAVATAPHQVSLTITYARLGV